MQLTLARHGQSTANSTGRWQGQGNCPLSTLGFRQAAALGARLRDRSFDRIIASDLRRAVQTAEALGRPVQTDSAWRELDLGRWEGLTREEVAERWPEEVAALHRGEDVPVGGAERWSDLERRVRAALEELQGRAEGEQVLLVAHGGVIITLLSSLMGVVGARPRRLGKLGNTSLSRVDLGPRPPSLWSYNDTLHAPEAGTEDAERARGRRVEALAVDSMEAGAELAARVRASAFGDPGADLAPLLPGRSGSLIRHPTASTLQAWNVGLHEPR